MQFKDKVIERRADFEGLFKGFTRLKAVSYVTSPKTLVDWMEKLGYESIEVVVGENLSNREVQDVAKEGTDFVAKLGVLMTEGRLRVHSPKKKSLHTKFYILEGDGKRRIIQGSPNLTESARRVNQVNYVWYLDDVADDSPVLARLLKSYDRHLTRGPSWET